VNSALPSSLPVSRTPCRLCLPVTCVAILAFMLAASGIAAAADAEISNLLVGSWLCDSGACWDEEIEFAIEDGKHVYNSWLHDRPAASDGAWSVAGNTVRIQCCDGLDYEYIVVRVTDTELVLRDADSGEETLLKRFIANTGDDSQPVEPAP